MTVSKDSTQYKPPSKIVTVLYYIFSIIFLIIGILLFTGSNESFKYLGLGFTLSSILALPLIHNVLRSYIKKRFVGVVTSILVIPVLIISFATSMIVFYVQNPVIRDEILSTKVYDVSKIIYCGNGELYYNSSFFNLQEFKIINAISSKASVSQVRLQPKDEIKPFKAMSISCLENLDGESSKTSQELAKNYQQKGVEVQIDDLKFVQTTGNITIKQLSFQESAQQRVFVIITDKGYSYSIRAQSTNANFEEVIDTANFRLNIRT